MLKPEVRGFFDQKTSTWTYVVYSNLSANPMCAIIDSVLNYNPRSGVVSTESADRVVEFIRSKSLEVQWILETHVHADHLSAAHYLKQRLGGQIAISQHILEVLETWIPLFELQNTVPADGSQFNHLFKDGETFQIGDLTATVLYTPGHTPADTTYLIGDAMFVGDLIFMPDVGSGRCDFPKGSAEKSYDSSRILFHYRDDYRVYVGHDYPPSNQRLAQCMTTLAEQKRDNMRLAEHISKETFVSKRIKDDQGKEVPELLYPSIQVNLAAGVLGKFLKIPVQF